MGFCAVQLVRQSDDDWKRKNIRYRHVISCQDEKENRQYTRIFQEGIIPALHPAYVKRRLYAKNMTSYLQENDVIFLWKWYHNFHTFVVRRRKLLSSPTVNKRNYGEWNHQQRNTWDETKLIEGIREVSKRLREIVQTHRPLFGGEIYFTGREGLRTAFRQSLPLPNYR